MINTLLQLSQDCHIALPFSQRMSQLVTRLFSIYYSQVRAVVQHIRETWEVGVIFSPKPLFFSFPLFILLLHMTLYYLYSSLFLNRQVDLILSVISALVPHPHFTCCKNMVLLWSMPRPPSKLALTSQQSHKSNLSPCHLHHMNFDSPPKFLHWGPGYLWSLQTEEENLYLYLCLSLVATTFFKVGWIHAEKVKWKESKDVNFLCKKNILSDRLDQTLFIFHSVSFTTIHW